MSDRPKWVKSLQRFLNDTLIDDDWDDSDDYILDMVQAAVDGVLCNVYGHEIVDDQCMIPEHRYCVWCRRRESLL